MSERQPLTEDQLLRLQSYLDDECTAAERLAFETELEENVELAAEWERWQMLTAAISPSAMPDVDPEIDFSTIIVNRIQANNAPPAIRFGFVTILQLIFGLAILIGGWPYISAFQPRTLTAASTAESVVLEWVNRLGGWITEQQLLIGDLVGDLSSVHPPQVGPEMMTTLLVVAAIGGLVWLLSVRYILRTTDWRPI